ncbi:MAG TPA: ABC transporter ATP-binding protein [Candidatus Blautia merdavium]|uniref:ABC transporter ATP-binding protein n=1 Tax=Candidatus Blautia merdavium TaxID=2838494 RepID=A0A9D2PR20_9FIRM|nr:ABC transporter ATP-binding protein [Candidatus Blautia merdavium]
MKTLSAEHVTFTYQGKYQKVEALKEVTCTFETGKLYCVIGHSGSGKSTLLSLLAGLGRPGRGQILADGQDLAEIGYDRYRREMVSVIYQAFCLFPALTVLENVMYPMEISGRKRKEAERKARELLAKVGLSEELYRKFPAMLSGGEQQRTAIARALASSAKTILADEPTGNLDSENGKKILGILEELVEKENYCVVIVTHDLEIAARADVLYRMKDGKLWEERGETV